MDHCHSLYPSFRGKDILCKILGLIDFRRQSSRNVFGTASRSTVHLCSRWHYITQSSHMAMWEIISHVWRGPDEACRRPQLTLECAAVSTWKVASRTGNTSEALWLAPSSKFSLQTDPCWPSKLFSTHCFSGEFHQGALIWETFTGASSYDSSTWFWPGDLVRID